MEKKMKFTTSNAGLLIPIEWNLPHLETLVNNFSLEVVHHFPVPVIPYPVLGEEQRYILGDGHHRSAVLYLREEPVPLKILETDEEILFCNEGAFFREKNREGFLRSYYTSYKPCVDRHGIKSLPDFVKHYYSSEQIKEFQEMAKWRT